MLEVEVKVKVNLTETEEKLKSLGFIKGTTVYEKDTYYNSEFNDLKAADKALRIREHKETDSNEIKYTLNFKGPKLDDFTMTRAETQFEIPSFEQGETVLKGLGYFAAGGVEKNRLHYTKENITCCLDEVIGLGEFLEIEIMAEETEYNAAIEEIGELLNSLGLKMDDSVRHSYLSMLMERHS